LWETKNLADDTEYKPVLEKMRGLLKEEVLKSRDVMFLPEYEVGLLSDNTTAYEFRLDNEKYPLKDIYKAASLAGFRGKEVAEKQVELLSDDNPVIRYWAILGLRSQNPEIAKSFSDKILEAMDDEYPPVSVIASVIAYGMFNNKTAEDNLKLLCAHENLDISLMAVYSLLYTEPEQRKPFIETIWKVWEMEDRDYNVRAACMDLLGSLGLVPNNPDYRE
jgi:hypothetical protein